MCYGLMLGNPKETKKSTIFLCSRSPIRPLRTLLEAHTTNAYKQERKTLPIPLGAYILKDPLPHKIRWRWVELIEREREREGR